MEQANKRLKVYIEDEVIDCNFLDVAIMVFENKPFLLFNF